jgi:hypothetical protein
MRLTTILAAALMALAAMPAVAATQIEGQYLETRSNDVFTGACVANSEMGLSGEEATLAWTVTSGSWNDVDLAGLSVVAVIRGSATLGHEYYDALPAKAVVIVDQAATGPQRNALIAFAQAEAGELLDDIVEVKAEAIEVGGDACSKDGCASLKAGDLVEISTRCIGDGDHLCGNETAFYPPLTKGATAKAAFTNVSSYSAKDLGHSWTIAESRSAFVGTFAR